MSCKVKKEWIDMEINMEIREDKYLDKLFLSIQENENCILDVVTLFRLYHYLISSCFETQITCQCCQDLSDIPKIGKTIYIFEFLKTITDWPILEKIIHVLNDSLFSETLKNQIDSYFEWLDNHPDPSFKPEKNFYYEKLFQIPWTLSKTEVSLYHYQYRKITDFNDIIRGHPKASHGWYRDTLDDLSLFGGLLNQESSSFSIAGLIE